MSWKRGFWRLWLLGTFCWIGVGVWSEWKDLEPLFKSWPTISSGSSTGNTTQAPTDTPSGGPFGGSSNSPSSQGNRFSEYAQPRFSLPLPTLPSGAWQDAPPEFFEPGFSPWERALAFEALIALLLPPAIVLALGFGVAWVVAGFKPKPR